jgi:hypothetical protein
VLKVFHNRIPDKKNIVTVYAVAMFLVYTWTLFTSFWKLPSWLFFLEVGEIISIYSYAFLVNFMESILLLSLVLLASVTLPRHWWTDTVIPKGFVLILVLLGSAALHLTLYRTPDTREMFVSGQFNWWAGTLLIVVFLAWMTGRVNWICHGLENLADRFVVFLYIYLPLTVFAVLIILVRLYL